MVDKQDILAPSNKIGPHRIGMSSDVIDFLHSTAVGRPTSTMYQK